MASSVESDLATLAGVRIFFGHQSVGDNIVQGVRELLVHQPGGLRVEMLGGVPSSEPGISASAKAVAASATRESGLLLHTKIGQNHDPSSKCDDFRRIVNHGLAAPVDVALFKFCYVDIHSGTDVEALATTYISCLDDLRQRHPETLFVPITVPLRQMPSGPGVWIRQLLGRTNQTHVANGRRYAFNQLLRTRYAGRPLFDLAAVEAGRSGETGAPASVTVESLRGAYTDDGGHLNAAGRAAASIAFVNTLAAAVRIGHAG